jgi:hypothetical protein
MLADMMDLSIEDIGVLDITYLLLILKGSCP